MEVVTTRLARAVIGLLIGVVFAGWMLLWVIYPTSYYMKWQVMITARVDSTYFGTEGADLLTFVLPVLFMSVLGCIYLHLGKNIKSCQKKSTGAKSRANSLLSLWRRPVLVKGPLGIVSGIELTFFAMFLALLVWALTMYLHSSYAKMNATSAHHQGEKLWEAKLESAGLRLGLVGTICFSFLFFPVTRGSSLLPLVGLTSEASVKYHIWLGHIVMALFTAHGLCYIVYWAAKKQISQMLKWDMIGVSNVAGELALICGLLMWVTSSGRVRRKMFEVFYYTHHLYFLFFFFFIVHVGTSFYGLAIFGLILPGIYLFLVDRCLRFLQSRQRVRLLAARLLPCETLELSFSKSPGLSYSPTSIMFVNVPSISRLQWHPFTVTSNSSLEQDKLSVVIKSEGIWSQKLYQILSSPSPVDHLDVSVEGPYGSPSSTNFFRHDKLVMVSGGSGITPFISIIRELIFQSSTLEQQAVLPQVQLVCIFRNSKQLSMTDLLLPLAGTGCDMSRLRLLIDAYVTREGPNSENNKQKHLQRTLWFKTNPCHAPVSAVLGPNGWLWLSAIISSSFVMFLILLGITTRYYFYPIDHDTNMIFPHISRSLLNMLFICLFIAVASIAAVLWNKKRSAMEAMVIEDGSWFNNGDRELESQPHQSLSQSIRVHYGKRPDIEKILLASCDESSVGVLASGPKGMRQRVAAICSAGLADNLHFESISFSW
ncbi:ferric reduction oxidase 2-like [Aristolochia californica]|uniref:ferric reduction oxidase 2-like n=1 Tax=Aristolochia californica TaxID=171875 RepID=UPI0035E13427